MPIVVDFPAPFGPSRQKISPGFTSSESPSRALICGFGCFDFSAGRAMMPVAAIGGAELYTLRRSSVRTPIAMNEIPGKVPARFREYNAGKGAKVTQNHKVAADSAISAAFLSVLSDKSLDRRERRERPQRPLS